jgi:hypothetical protein
MGNKSVAKVRKLTASIAKPYVKRLERPYLGMKNMNNGTGAKSWFRTQKTSGLRTMVAKRIRAERAAGYIKKNRKDY